MNNFLHSIKNVFSLSLETNVEHDEAYLAESVDLVDLEMRMRQLEQHRRSGPVDGPYGLFIR